MIENDVSRPPQETRFGQVDMMSAKEPVNIETLARVANQPENEVVSDGHPLFIRTTDSSNHNIPAASTASPAIVAVTADRQTSQRKIRRFKKSLKPTSTQLVSIKNKGYSSLHSRSRNLSI